MAENVTKKIIIKEVAALSKVNQETTKAVLNGFIQAITQNLVRGNKINIDGFGTFDVADIAARPGRNPITGETIEVKAHKNPKFKFGKNIKDAVNGRE